jgi:glycosyltransferase involved in cell wall biosynthesis
MTDATLFEKMCRPLPGDFLPAAFPVPLQQYALSGSWTERHLSEIERNNWLSRTLLTYLLHKRPISYFADKQVPAFLSPKLGVWLNEVTSTVEGMPVTRVMEFLGKQLAPYDRVYDIKKKEGLIKLYADLAGSMSITLRLPHSLLPGFVFEHLAEKAVLPQPSAVFPLSIGMMLMWRNLFPGLPFEPSSLPHVEAFAAQLVSLVIGGRLDPRILTKEIITWLNAPTTAGQVLQITNFMVIVLRLAGVEQDARWKEEAFLRALTQQMINDIWATLAIPAAVAEAHERTATLLGLKLPASTLRPFDGKEPAYVWGYMPPKGLDPSSRQVNLMAVDDLTLQGARLSTRLQTGLQAGSVNAVTLADKAEARMKDVAAGPINIIPCRLDILADFMLRRGLVNFEGRYNIGYGVWETDRLPQGIRPALDLLDEIWVATESQKKLFEKETSKPVYVLPHPVNEAPVSKNLSRVMLGVPEDAFVFTTVVECYDWLSRKNPHAAMQAFQMAFPNEKNVALIVKTRDIAKSMSQREEGVIQRMQNIWNKDGRVFPVHDMYSDSELQALLGLSDAYISLHRSSAYGSVMIEAMMHGKPVIATNGSDYLSAKTGYPVKSVVADVVFEGYAFLDKEAGHAWSDPEIADAAAQMKAVYANREAAKKIAAEGQKLVQQRYSATACGKAMQARIEAILQSDAMRRKKEKAA